MHAQKTFFMAIQPQLQLKNTDSFLMENSCNESIGEWSTFELKGCAMFRRIAFHPSTSNDEPGKWKKAEIQSSLSRKESQGVMKKK